MTPNTSAKIYLSVDRLGKVLAAQSSADLRVAFLRDRGVDEDQNFVSLARINLELIAKAEGVASAQRACWTWTQLRFRFYSQQEQRLDKGHFESICYHSLLLFNREGNCVAAKLRPWITSASSDFSACGRISWPWWCPRRT